MSTQSQTSSQSKVAFITGGNRGLGFETARELGQKGIKVVIGARVWIGDNVSVLPGARIGAGSIIGAHSVVTGEIPAKVCARTSPTLPSAVCVLSVSPPGT